MAGNVTHVMGTLFSALDMYFGGRFLGTGEQCTDLVFALKFAFAFLFILLVSSLPPRHLSFSPWPRIFHFISLSCFSVLLRINRLGSLL
jgi:hypothetical protein